jgi:pimeloyl-ACP methyl ester carboxylesterase
MSADPYGRELAGSLAERDGAHQHGRLPIAWPRREPHSRREKSRSGRERYADSLYFSGGSDGTRFCFPGTLSTITSPEDAKFRRPGFDVFMLDFQGSGLSSRPTMDDPCNANPAQRSILTPNPLSVPCPGPAATYPAQLINSGTDWDELDTVVDYIRAIRAVDKVALVSWSEGAFRIGPYAIQHPDKVESALFFAPIFNPSGRASKAGTRFDSPVSLPVTSPATQFGFPMTLTTRASLMTLCDSDQHDDQQQ